MAVFAHGLPALLHQVWGNDRENPREGDEGPTATVTEVFHRMVANPSSAQRPVSACSGLIAAAVMQAEVTEFPAPASEQVANDGPPSAIHSSQHFHV